jgi:HK97 family phage major capsid protein
MPEDTKTQTPVANVETLIAEIKREFDEGKASRKATDERIRALEEAVKTNPRPIGSDGQDPEQARPYRMMGAMRAASLIRDGRSADEAWKGFEYEREISKRAAMSSGDDAAGAYLISPETDPTPITSLRPETVVLKAGARVVTPKGAPYRVPEITAGVSGGWIDNNAAPSETKPATALKQMQPRKYGMLVKCDRSLLSMADPSIEPYIREDLTLKQAEVIDLACLTGTGASGQPKGLLVYSEMLVGGSQVVAIGTNGGDPTFKKLADLIGKLEDANALRGKLAMVSHPKTRRVVKKEMVAQFSGDTGGVFRLPMSPILSDAALAQAIGYEWLVTTQLPITNTKGTASDCSPIVFGNWADLLVARWGGSEIRPLFERGAEYDQVWFVLFFQMDVLRLRTESFVAIRDARVNNA